MSNITSSTSNSINTYQIVFEFNCFNEAQAMVGQYSHIKGLIEWHFFNRSLTKAAEARAIEELNAIESKIINLVGECWAKHALEGWK